MFIVIGIVVFILLAVILVYISKYKTVGPDEALIVTGSYLGSKNVHTDDSGNRIKIIRGGGTLYSRYSNNRSRSASFKQT